MGILDKLFKKKGDGCVAVNEKHPDFKEYKKRWDALVKQMDRELEQAPESPQPPVRDGGAFDVITKKYSKKLSALQKEFAHLYK